MRTEKLNSDTITAESIFQMSAAITIRGLKTTLAKSANEKIAEMLNDCIAYAHDPIGYQGDDGAEILQNVACYLSEHMGQELSDATTDGQTDKDGQPITILRGAFRVVRKTIYNHEKRQFHECYIDDYESDHGAIKVPAKWDIPDMATWEEVTRRILTLNLTIPQMEILSARLRGYSNKRIAKMRKTDAANIGRRLAKIAEKYTAVYGEIPTLKLKFATK